jgi:hypothetical protein
MGEIPSKNGNFNGMGLEINEHILQLSGTACLTAPLQEGESYKIQTEIDIVSVVHKNRQDGTKDLVYKGKTTGIVDISDKLDNKVFGKKTKTESQKLRFAIELYHNSHNGEPDYEFIHHDSEEFYRQVHDKLRARLDNIIRLIFSE